MTMTRDDRYPLAVLISDIHFTPATLDLATQSLQHAMEVRTSLAVPLIIAGDTLDSKAIIRGECANRLISIFEGWLTGRCYMLVGNHDMISEKGEEHSLNFLSTYVNVVQSPVQVPELDGVWLLPYFNNAENLLKALEGIPKGSTLIMHQGVMGAEMGHYAVDKTSLPREAFEDYRVISGHYHKAQDIKCGRPRKGAVGLFSYIGNPYTLTFAEANDGPKGFQILYSDGLMEQVPTNLRKHVILEYSVDNLPDAPPKGVCQDDIIWLKLTGPRSVLDKVKKADIASKLFGNMNFKLDKIYLDVEQAVQASKAPSTDEEIFDTIIDLNSPGEPPEQIAKLKKLWRELV